MLQITSYNSCGSSLAVPNVFNPRDLLQEDNVTTNLEGAGLGMIQLHYIYCAFYSSSDTATDLTGGRQVDHPKVGNPLLYLIQSLAESI